MSDTRLEFLIVDPQNDFCDPKGQLYVPGAEEDSKRLAYTISRLRDRISHISVTLDTHRLIDIAHPIFWVDNEGRHPAPLHSSRRRISKRGYGGPLSLITWTGLYATLMSWQKTIDTCSAYGLLTA